jgi:hypothetical protein
VSDSGPFVLIVVYLSEQSNLRIGKLYNAIRELGKHAPDRCIVEASDRCTDSEDIDFHAEA